MAGRVVPSPTITSNARRCCRILANASTRRSRFLGAQPSDGSDDRHVACHPHCLGKSQVGRGVEPLDSRCRSGYGTGGRLAASRHRGRCDRAFGREPRQASDTMPGGASEHAAAAAARLRPVRTRPQDGDGGCRRRGWRGPIPSSPSWRSPADRADLPQNPAEQRYIGMLRPRFNGSGSSSSWTSGFTIPIASLIPSIATTMWR